MINVRTCSRWQWQSPSQTAVILLLLHVVQQRRWFVTSRCPWRHDTCRWRHAAALVRHCTDTATSRWASTNVRNYYSTYMLSTPPWCFLGIYDGEKCDYIVRVYNVIARSSNRRDSEIALRDRLIIRSRNDYWQHSVARSTDLGLDLRLNSNKIAQRCLEIAAIRWNIRDPMAWWSK